MWGEEVKNTTIRSVRLGKRKPLVTMLSSNLGCPVRNQARFNLTDPVFPQGSLLRNAVAAQFFANSVRTLTFRIDRDVRALVEAVVLGQANHDIDSRL